MGLLGTTRPDKHDRVFLVPCKKLLVGVRYIHAFTGKVAFYQVPETQGHLKLDTLYELLCTKLLRESIEFVCLPVHMKHDTSL